MVTKNLVDRVLALSGANCTVSWGHPIAFLNLSQVLSEPCSRTIEYQNVALHLFDLVERRDAAGHNYVFVFDTRRMKHFFIRLRFCNVEVVLSVFSRKTCVIYSPLFLHTLPFFPHTFAHPVPSIHFVASHQIKKSDIFGLCLCNPPAPFQPSSHRISFSLHPPCQLSQPRMRAAVCQVWIDAVLAELSAWPLLDVTQIFSLRRGSRDQSECELCNNGDGRHWQVFGLGGIWPTPDSGKIPPAESLSIPASQVFCS